MTMPQRGRNNVVSQHTDAAAACLDGLTAQNAGRMDDAVAHFRHALAIAPTLLDIRLLLAFALGAHDCVPEARTTLDGTPGLATMSPADLRRLADAGVQLGAADIALRAVRLLVEGTDHDADLEATLGALLQRTGATDEAGHVLHRAILRWPDHVPTVMNTARLLVADGHFAGALRHYDHALRVNPRHAAARWHRGLLRLTMGDLSGGWTDHEARRTLPVHTVGVPVGIPAWDGRNAAGKTLLLWGEQGLGDQIQGVRFARNLMALGAHVIVRCAPPLQPLFAGLPGVTLVVASNEPLPPCDAHVPMLSVPFLLKLFDESLYDAGSYLTPALESLAPELPVPRSSGRTRVGFAWAGSPGHTNDHLRSLPASQLAGLLDGVSSQWISLQTGARASDLCALLPSVRAAVGDVGPSLTNFVDTAHVLSALDRVVTVDTAVAHLAGALGIPTLLLLPFVPDWRWQLVREDSPWYASIRIIRQPSEGDWNSVIGRVHRELSAGGQARAA